MIVFENVHKTYKKDSPVFNNLSMSILPGEFVVITGAPGAGKTTLLKMILNEERPTEGSVLYDGEHLHKISSGKLKAYRRDLGTIFQDFRLLPNKTAFENVAFALEVLGFDDEEIYHDAMEVLDIVGISHRKDHFPKELSGGEKQKVSIARALISRPKVILADEPTGSLDEAGAKEIVQVLKAINALGTTIIVATHNDKLFSNIKGVRKITIKPEGVVIENLKGIVYSSPAKSEFQKGEDNKKVEAKLQKESEPTEE